MRAQIHMGAKCNEQACMHRCHMDVGEGSYSAAAAGLAQLQVHSIAPLQLDPNIAFAPVIFCPRGLLTVQHYVGAESIHGDGSVQALVQIIQRGLQAVRIAQHLLKKTNFACLGQPTRLNTRARTYGPDKAPVSVMIGCMGHSHVSCLGVSANRVSLLSGPSTIARAQHSMPHYSATEVAVPQHGTGSTA